MIKLYTETEMPAAYIYTQKISTDQSRCCHRVSFSHLLVCGFYLNTFEYCGLSTIHVDCSRSSLQSNGERVAVKMFTGGVEFRALKREIEVVCSLPHQENIVKLFGVEEEVS